MSADGQLRHSDVRMGSKSVRALLVEEMPAAALMIVIFFVFSFVFTITHSMGKRCIRDQVRRAIGKGMFWVSLGPLSAVKMRRSILVGTAEKQKFHSSEQSQNGSDFLSVDFWWRRQKLCKVRDGAWAQLKFPAGFH